MKINEVTVNEDDSLIFTIGDLETNIVPSDKDLEDWRKILFKVLGGNYTAVVPPVLHLTVVHFNKNRSK